MSENKIPHRMLRKARRRHVMASVGAVCNAAANVGGAELTWLITRTLDTAAAALTRHYLTKRDRIEASRKRKPPRKTLTGAQAVLDLLDNQADPYMDTDDPAVYVPGRHRYDDYRSRRASSPACAGCGQVRPLPLLVTWPTGRHAAALVRVCAVCAAKGVRP